MRSAGSSARSEPGRGGEGGGVSLLRRLCPHSEEPPHLSQPLSGGARGSRHRQRSCAAKATAGRPPLSQTCRDFVLPHHGPRTCPASSAWRGQQKKRRLSPAGAGGSRICALQALRVARSPAEVKPPLGRPKTPAVRGGARHAVGPQAGTVPSLLGELARGSRRLRLAEPRGAVPRGFPLAPFFSVPRPPPQAMNFGRGGPPVVVLNVGGTRYSFAREVLKDFPLRRVSRLHGCLSEQDVLEVCDDYDRERNEYFFDRHSEAFGFIMLYVRYGHLRFVPHMCELSFYNEMIYWGLECSHLDYCCQRRLDDRMSDTYTFYSAEDLQAEPAGGWSRSSSSSGSKSSCHPPPGRGEGTEQGSSHAAPPPGGEEKKWLERMRRTFEEPTSSVAAQILATVSIIFVIVSMVVLCASTTPEWRAAENRSMEEQSRYTADSVREPSG
ncbi:UNVERIFIED_CONTAM: hypothetical protein K2H54_046579 [Gekko kuhli]